ncbi:hypothetical protein KVR01_011985 [Diaporthe batatas]|uniref:uncharacterized protein n=1 Tax=Diaporthe batatas TaxID=748121 RepID=UPI001D058882|nr:uncharacterized protein KVR01_011985 [Diaporthe batatas]KAG8158224.1 hypothetical protein KVR01_011985 [Diaporthe batatas]
MGHLETVSPTINKSVNPTNDVTMDGDSQIIDEIPHDASNEPVTSPTSPGGGPESDAGRPGTAAHQGADLAASTAVPEFPGLRTHGGRDVTPDDVKEVIRLLGEAGAPACVAGVYALRYFGAGRVSTEIDICIPDEALDNARVMFENDARFEEAPPAPPLMTSLRHTRPTFLMKGVYFVFILIPASDYFIDPSPDCCELSLKGIPYPKPHHFARSLLVLQNPSDLCDFIDGMDLDKDWGESNLNFDELQQKGIEFSRRQNDVREQMGLGPLSLKLDVDYRAMWNTEVDEKEKRIEPMKKGRYKTRWRRIKNDMDPRLKDRPL